MQNRLALPQHVTIVTHSFLYGASEALRDYLVSQKIQDLAYIAHPLLADEPRYTYEFYSRGTQTIQTVIIRKNAGWVVSYALDFIRTVLTVCTFQSSDYLFIGINPVNAFAGLVLRGLGKVKRVIFFGIDFTPRRYSSFFLNAVYHTLESYVVRHADICWNVSPKIAEGRRKYLGINPIKHPQQVVPIGIWKKDIVKTVKRTNTNRLVFAGTLWEKQGVQAVLFALSHVIKKIPNVIFTIIGSGEYEKELKEIVLKLRLDKYVKFLGWIIDQERVRSELVQSDIALAVYQDSGNKDTNFTYYADPTKIKTYTSCGLPVVMTGVPYNAKELESFGAAFLVEYSQEKISEMLISVLTDSKKLLSAKKSAVAYAKTCTWETIFFEAFKNL